MPRKPRSIDEFRGDTSYTFGDAWRPVRRRSRRIALGCRARDKATSALTRKLLKDLGIDTPKVIAAMRKISRDLLAYAISRGPNDIHNRPFPKRHRKRKPSRSKGTR